MAYAPPAQPDSDATQVASEEGCVIGLGPLHQQWKCAVVELLLLVVMQLLLAWEHWWGSSVQGCQACAPNALLVVCFVGNGI